jgi:hypothetical protein
MPKAGGWEVGTVSQKQTQNTNPQYSFNPQSSIVNLRLPTFSTSQHRSFSAFTPSSFQNPQSAICNRINPKSKINNGLLPGA